MICENILSPLRYAVSILDTEKLGGKFPPTPEKRGDFLKGRVEFCIVGNIQNCIQLKKKNPYYTCVLIIDYQ